MKVCCPSYTFCCNNGQRCCPKNINPIVELITKPQIIKPIGGVIPEVIEAFEEPLISAQPIEQIGKVSIPEYFQYSEKLTLKP